MSETVELNLTIAAVYDNLVQAVGVEVDASDAFDQPEYTQQLLEILATINAQSNQIASEVINTYAEDDNQRRALLEHYASLKEYILENMLNENDEGQAPE